MESGLTSNHLSSEQGPPSKTTKIPGPSAQAFTVLSMLPEIAWVIFFANQHQTIMQLQITNPQQTMKILETKLFIAQHF